MNEILGALKKLNDTIVSQIKGVKPFSWQTLLFLGLLSWMAALAISNDIVAAIIYRVGWIFFALGLAWALEHTKFEFFGLKIFPGPWVTGALICAFVLDGLPGGVPVQLILWPLVSAAIALTPKLLKHGWQLFNPLSSDAKKMAGDRQEALLLILFSLLLCCWIQFYYLIQSWLIDYPSLRVDDYNRSSFVTRVPIQSGITSRGAALLNSTENVLREDLSNQPWSAVEQWLRTLDQQVPPLQQKAIAMLPESGRAEDRFWSLQAQVLPGQPDYTIRFRAFWRGPSSRPGGYYAEKLCQISPAPISQVAVEGTIQESNANRIDCQPTTDRNWVGNSSRRESL